MPPIYLSTGKYLFTFSLSKGFSSLLFKNLMKYHEESTNVSNVSVSLNANFFVFGHIIFRQSSLLSKAFPLPSRETS